MFTRDQIEEIKKKLIMLGIKDTQFPDAHKLNGEEIIAIVQDGENKKITLSSIINDDFINVSKDTTEILTLSTAVSKIDTNNRKLGQVITFKDSANSWAIRQFAGSSLDNWNDISLWKSISGIDELKSQVETNAEDISVLSDEIERHDASILKLGTDVSALQSKVDVNTTSISQINNTIAGHEESITQINAKLDEHTESINAKITTDRIEDGVVTSEKIATTAFDSTLSVSGKIAPADVVGEKLTELEGNIGMEQEFAGEVGSTKAYYFNYVVESSKVYFVKNISDGNLSFKVRVGNSVVFDKVINSGSGAVVSNIEGDNIGGWKTSGTQLKFTIEIDDSLKNKIAGIKNDITDINNKSISRESKPAPNTRLGYVILDASKSFASQVNNISNTIFEIQDSFNLRAATVQLGDNVTLFFNGGILKNGVLKGNGSRIKAESYQIFDFITFEGSFCVEGWNVCWFGAKADCILSGRDISGTDNKYAIERAFTAIANLNGNTTNDGAYSSFNGIYFPSGRYLVNSTINLPKKAYMYGRGVDSTIVCNYNGNLFYLPYESPNYKDLYVRDICFQTPGNIDLPKSTAFCNEYSEEDGGKRTFFSRCVFSRCKFMYFNVTLDLRVCYYLRIDGCEFNVSRNTDIVLLNANDSSITNNMFTNASFNSKKVAIKLIKGHLVNKDNAIGVNITGNDFSFGAGSIQVDCNICGMNITGNYIEPSNDVKYNGETVPSYYRPFLVFGNGTMIQDVNICGNGIFEDYSNWSSKQTVPRAFVLLNCERINNSNIDACIALDSTIKGYGNTGRTNFYSKSSLMAKYNNIIQYEAILLDSSKTDEEKRNAFSLYKDVRESLMQEMSEHNEESIEIGKTIFACYIDRLNGESWSNFKTNLSGNPNHNLYEKLKGVKWNKGSNTWNVNGLDDITNEQMDIIYESSGNLYFEPNSSQEFRFAGCHARTILPFANSEVLMNWYGYIPNRVNAFAMFLQCSELEKVVFGGKMRLPSNSNSMFNGCIKLKTISDIISMENCTDVANMFRKCQALETLQLSDVKTNISLEWSPMLSVSSVEYIIRNAGTADIEIRLHNDAYTRAIADSSVQSAMTLKQNVSIIPV